MRLIHERTTVCSRLCDGGVHLGKRLGAITVMGPEILHDKRPNWQISPLFQAQMTANSADQSHLLASETPPNNVLVCSLLNEDVIHVPRGLLCGSIATLLVCRSIGRENDGRPHLIPYHLMGDTQIFTFDHSRPVYP